MSPRDPLTRLLRELPRRRVDDAFVRRMLDRLDDDAPAGSSLGRRWATSIPRLAPLAAGFALAVVLATLWVASSGSSGRLEPSEVGRLAAERSQIENELEALRRQADDTPVIYLGGDERVDLVLDLDHLARSRATAGRATDPPALGRSRSTRADVRPATY